MLWPTPVINFWNPILNRHCSLLFTLMISFDPLIVSRGVFSLTLKWCLTDINQGLFFKRPSEEKPKASHAHVQSLGKNILLLSSKPKQLKPGKTEHVGFCSWCLFIPNSSNPQKFFCSAFSLSISKGKQATRLLLKAYGLLVVVFDYPLTVAKYWIDISPWKEWSVIGFDCLVILLHPYLQCLTICRYNMILNHAAP